MDPPDPDPQDWYQQLTVSCFQCDACGKSFKQSQHLKDHKRSVHSTLHECEVRDSVFFSEFLTIFMWEVSELRKYRVPYLDTVLYVDGRVQYIQYGTDWLTPFSGNLLLCAYMYLYRTLLAESIE
jgi:hypothetical protein